VDTVHMPLSYPQKRRLRDQGPAGFLFLETISRLRMDMILWPRGEQLFYEYLRLTID
jgi:hypothetical protein